MNGTTSDDNEGVLDTAISSDYANNTLIEPSVWDVKLIFGEFEKHLGKEHVEWHTSITMPWAQAKLLSFYLRLNIEVHEIQNGAIRVPGSMLPARPPELNPKDVSDPHARAIIEMLQRNYREFIEGLTTSTKPDSENSDRVY